MQAISDWIQGSTPSPPSSGKKSRHLSFPSWPSSATYLSQRSPTATSSSSASSMASDQSQSSCSRGQGHERFLRLDSLEDDLPQHNFKGGQFHKSKTEPQDFRYHQFNRGQTQGQGQTAPNMVGAKFHEDAATKQEKNWFSPSHSPPKVKISKPQQEHRRPRPLGAKMAQQNLSEHAARGRQNFAYPPPPLATAYSYQGHGPGLQMPYNMTKGTYEIWPSIPVQNLQQNQHQVAGMYQVFEGIPYPTHATTESQAAAILLQNGVDFAAQCAAFPWGVGNSVMTMLDQFMHSVTSYVSPAAAICAHQVQAPTLNPEAPSFVPPKAENSGQNALNPNAAAFVPSNAHSALSEEIPATISDRDTVQKYEVREFSIPSVNISRAEVSPQNSCEQPVIVNQRDHLLNAKPQQGQAVRKVTPPHSAPPSECSTPMMDEEALKSVADRQVTPWVAGSTPEQNHNREESDTSTLNDSSFVENTLDLSEFVESDCSVTSESFNRRCQRTLSTSSSEDGESFISFGADSSPKERTKPALFNEPAAKNSKSCVNKILGGVDSDESSSEEEEEDEDDGDWDEVDDSSATSWQDEFMNCGLTCPMQAKKPKKSCDLPQPEPEEDEQTKEKRKTLAKANQRWTEAYANTDLKLNCDRDQGRVTFSDEDTCIEEDPAMSEDLKAARKSDHKQRMADQERMNNMMKKVFEPSHRRKMFSIIYGEEL